MYGIQVDGIVCAQFVAPLTVKSVQPVFSSDTMSLKRRISKRAVQRWEIQANLMPLSFGGHTLMVDLVTKGKDTEVTAVMPQNYGVIKARTNSATPSATGTAGATSITVIGVSGIIPRGTFIRFANHSKVYMTTNDRSGNGIINIFPELRATLTGQLMHCNDDVILSCYYDLEQVSGMVYTDGILMDLGQITLVEKL